MQKPIADFGQERFDAQYPDTITEAGIVGLLAENDVDQDFLKSVRFKIVDVSIGKHKSKGIVVHGHQECAGNPVSDEQQKDDIRRSVLTLQKIVGGGVPVVGVFVKRSASNTSEWMIEEVPQTETA